MSTLLTIVVTILIFMILISLHEFGHFIVAKMSGVSVLEFAVGMGPAVLKRQKGETLYSLRALPIGGYCKLEGEDTDSDDPKAFGNQKIWKRFLVISAGAILNLVLGFALVMVLIGITGQITTTKVGTILDNSYMAQSGIKTGDKILAINGQKIKYYSDILSTVQNADTTKDAAVTVQRDGKNLDFSLKLSYEESTINYETDGANITSRINGVESKSFKTYTEEESAANSDKIGKQESSQRYILGFEPMVEPVSISNIFGEAYHYTISFIKMVYVVLGELFTGKVGINQFSGPVGVGVAVGSAMASKQAAVPNVLGLIAMLTINLGIFNLLPLPALDGGRLFFLLIELIFRKPVPPEKEGMVHTIGLFLMMALAVVIMFNDIIKLF